MHPFTTSMSIERCSSVKLILILTAGSCNECLVEWPTDSGIVRGFKYFIEGFRGNFISSTIGLVLLCTKVKARGMSSSARQGICDWSLWEHHVMYLLYCRYEIKGIRARGIAEGESSFTVARSVYVSSPCRLSLQFENNVTSGIHRYKLVSLFFRYRIRFCNTCQVFESNLYDEKIGEFVPMAKFKLRKCEVRWRIHGKYVLTVINISGGSDIMVLYENIYLLFVVLQPWYDYVSENLELGPVFLFCASSVLVAVSKMLFSFCLCFVLALER